jgi:hypothetical protein
MIEADQERRYRRWDREQADAQREWEERAMVESRRWELVGATGRTCAAFAWVELVAGLFERSVLFVGAERREAEAELERIEGERDRW